MKKRTGTVEVLKSVVLAALFVSMVLLASTYILSTQGRDIFEGTEAAFDGVLSFQNGAEYGAETLDDKYLSPEFIGLKRNSSQARAYVAGDGYLFDVYSYIMPYITEAFGENSTLERFEDDAGMSLWKQCIDMSDYVYVRYHSEFPFSLLYAYSEETDDASIYKSLDDIESYIYEFFIVKSGGGNALVARNENGDIFRFVPTGEGAVFDFTALDRYTKRGKAFAFACELFGYNSGFDTVPIISDSMATERISTKTVILDELGDTEGEGFRSLMRLFDFNPDKLNGYNDTDDESASVFVETHGNLRMSTKKLEYSSSTDGGISALDFLGYRKSDSDYDVYDMLKATQGFVEAARSISKNSFGSDADLNMTRVYFDDGVLTVEYSYFFDNVRIDYGEEGYAFSFKIKDKIFTSVTVRPLCVESVGESVRCFSQKMILNMQKDRVFSDEISKVNMKLRYDVKDTDNSILDTEWAFYVK